MFFDIGDSSRKPVSGGPKDPLGCLSFDQGSPLPPLPQRVPTLPLPPTPKFHLLGGRRHALVLHGCEKKPRTEKRFDRGPQRDHGSSGRGSPGAGCWQSHRPRNQPKPARCAVRTLTPVVVEAKCDKNASFHNKRERFRLFWICSQLLSPTPQQPPLAPTKQLPTEPPAALPLRGKIRLISPTIAPPLPAPNEPPSTLPCPGCSLDVARIIAGLWSGSRRRPPALRWSRSLQPLPMHLALPTADMWHFERDVGVEDALHPTLPTSVGNPRCVAFLWTLSRRSRNLLQHALNGNMHCFPEDMRSFSETPDFEESVAASKRRRCSTESQQLAALAESPFSSTRPCLPTRGLVFAGEPQLTDDTVPYVAVPAGDMCLYHCCAAAKDTSYWR